MIEEWNKEEDEEDRQRIEEDRKYLEGLDDKGEDMGDLKDPYNELWEVLRTKTLERGRVVSWIAFFL